MKLKLSILPKIFLAAFICMASGSLVAQSAKSNYEPSPEKEEIKESKRIKEKKHKDQFSTMAIAPTRNEFYEKRMKEKKKMIEEMKKPQYSDKMYFGHKNKPKKRPVGKRKFCNECGMTH